MKLWGLISLMSFPLSPLLWFGHGLEDFWSEFVVAKSFSIKMRQRDSCSPWDVGLLPKNGDSFEWNESKGICEHS